MSKIVNHTNGHGYLSIDKWHIIRVDSWMKDFVKEAADRISYDSTNDTFKYRCSRGKDAGRQTTLAKRLYASYKACKPISEITKPVRFKNGNRNDYRLENLTTRK